MRKGFTPRGVLAVAGVFTASVIAVVPSDRPLRLTLAPCAPFPAREAARLHAAPAGTASLLVEEPQPFDAPDRALEFFRAQRLGPGMTDLPLEQLDTHRAAILQREAAARAVKGAAIAPGGITVWSPVGPGNIGGRTRTIVIDPTNTAVMYAAGVAGGVWKSVDGGAGWNPTDDHMANLAVSTLAMDPTDPAVLYAGTGEGFGGSSFLRGAGIFKTTDAGASWTQLVGTNGPAFHWVNKIVVSPNDANRIYAGTRHGVYRSLNAGQTWTLVLANPSYATAAYQTRGSDVGCTDLAVRSDRDPDVLFAAFGSFVADGLFRSDDRGSTWFTYATASYQGRMSIAIAPSDNNRIYLTMADNGGLNAFGRIVSIFRSDDGVNFSAVLDPAHKFGPWLMSYVSIATGCVQAPAIYSQGWYDNAIAVDPVDPDVVWVGGIDLYRSDDGGQTFGMAGYWFYYREASPPPVYLHPDQHTIVFHPDYDGVANQTMYVGNDGGLFRTGNARAATTQEECPIGESPGPPPDISWQSLNNGYAVTQYYHGDVARTEDLFVAGAQDNGTSRVLARDTPNAWRLIQGGDGGYAAIDPNNSLRMFVETQFFPEIRRSLDGGETFTLAVDGITDTDGIFITPFAMDRNTPDVMWTGGTRPWRTTDGANGWTVAGPNFTGADRISAIGIAPSDGNIVYLGFNNGYVARSTNALGPAPTWQVFSSGLFGGWVSSVAVHPTNPEIALITYSTYGVPHVLRTVNGGSNWTSLDGSGATGIPDLPAHWVAMRPCSPELIYVGTELGMFASDDDGATWQPANPGLPHTVVEALAFRDDNTLVAFTYGRGVFLAALDPCATVGVSPAIAGARLELSAAPSPFRDGTTIRASLPVAGHARLSVHDVSGRLVAVLADGPHEAGPFSARWDGTDRSRGRVAAGVYFVRLAAAGAQKVQRVVKVE